jgi:hypothetical protein
VLVLALPVALFAAMLPVNEYVAMGIDGIDCDTPAVIVGLAGVTYLVYGIGAFGSGVLAARRPAARKRFAAVSLASLLVMAAVTPNAVRAMSPRDARACAERG